LFELLEEWHEFFVVEVEVVGFELAFGGLEAAVVVAEV
jgi:hypothetical protein